MTPPRKEYKPGIYNISNEVYHAAPGLNKSKLDMILDDPASIQWAKDCPVDDEKLKTLDFGSAFHTAVLEPDLFYKQYAVEPTIDRRTNAGKQAAKDFQAINGHKTILTAPEYKKLKLMAGSVFAHPMAKRLLENKTGTEVSIFVEDPETGLLLKSRNDLESEVSNLTLIGDLKTIDKIENIQRAIYEYHYHLQEVHYSRTYELHHGTPPDGFLFIFVAKTIELGRYPVKVVSLDELAREAGQRLWQEAILKYQECQTSNVWPGVCEVSLPHWAYKQ